MTKKRFLLGMLVMVLAFGMMVIGCEGDEEDTGAFPTDGTLAEKLAWVLDENNVQDGETYTITVNADEAIATQILGYNNHSNITIVLKGSEAERKISLSSNGSLFIVARSVTLVLDENITLQGKSDNTASLVSVNTGGTLTMNTGSKISGNTSSGVMIAGGVNVNGTFTMNGGEISGNTSSGTSNYGGGVSVSRGTFTMSGGEISGNTALYGGGVNVGSNGTFTMSSGKISGNTGGGVYVYESSATFTMSGGEISGNTGSGVYVSVSGGTFTMSGGKISDNTASRGGGVNVSINGTFTMSDGEISGNTATTSGGYGGGVYVDGGTFTMNSGKISGNTANTATTTTGYGGGVSVSSGTFTMNGGEISSNTAYRGGGVCIGLGKFYIVTGTVYGSDAAADKRNTASDNGTSLYRTVIGTVNDFVERGTFSGTTWNKKGDIVLTTSSLHSYTNDTISVVNGEFP
jgi:hypothetical protein